MKWKITRSQALSPYAQLGVYSEQTLEVEGSHVVIETNGRLTVYDGDELVFAVATNQWNTVRRM